MRINIPCDRFLTRCPMFPASFLIGTLSDSDYVQGGRWRRLEELGHRERKTEKDCDSGYIQKIPVSG